MANRAKAFGMKIQYHNRSRLAPELEGDAKYVSFDELLASSDVLSLNLALNASTRHIISKKEFGKMKDGIVIVNTARGALIDEKALVAALDSGKVMSLPFPVIIHSQFILIGYLGRLCWSGCLRKRACGGIRLDRQPRSHAAATHRYNDLRDAEGYGDPGAGQPAFGC